MSTQNLSSVTIEIISQYRQAGQQLGRANERGLQRTADAIGAQLSLSDGIDGAGLGVHLRIPQRHAPRPA